MSLWLLQKIWSWLDREAMLAVETALFFSWGVLMESPPPRHPQQDSGRILVGWWLLTATVIATAYRSSLVAHLTVLSFPSPIDSMEDLASRPDWSWGCRDFKGSIFLFFNQTKDPIMREVYKNCEFCETEEGLGKVLAGKFSYIDFESILTRALGKTHQRDWQSTCLPPEFVPL
ncbi:hypothetical protein O3P69_000674 [Scylla paramamosain]|uniref:Ionotropic glutamate receptor C-terminal domain-containing protein n=1 Tax=Scylla paramamosain TaxID=85552 RepID=A0AAW0UVS2_SCYPA